MGRRETICIEERRGFFVHGREEGIYNIEEEWVVLVE